MNIILADVGVQDSQGKLNLLGAGWSQIGVQANGLTGEMTVAVFLEIPWDMCNRELDVVLELHTDDRKPVQLPLPDGPSPLRITQKLVVPTPQGAPNGSPGSTNLMVRLQGGLPLAPGNWYAWRVFVEGEEHEEWATRFFVRRQPTMPSFGAPPIPS